MILDSIEADRRAAVVARFLETAASGDVEGFTLNLTAVNWPGAWHAILSETAKLGPVHSEIQAVFRAAWQGWAGQPADALIISVHNKWYLSRDLADNVSLLSEMRRLLPPEDANEPLVLYRGAPTEAEATRGLWWSPQPIYTEYYARDPWRNRNGSRRNGCGFVAAAFLPGKAIVQRVSRFEFLVDTSQLNDVFTVAELPVYTESELKNDVLMRSRLLGIPSGWDAKGISQWLSEGRTEAGVESIRFEREMALFQPVMTAAE